MPSFQHLPAELVILISDCLPTRDALSLAATNRAYHKLLDERVWQYQVNCVEAHLGPLWWAVTRRACTLDTLAVAKRALLLGASASYCVSQDAFSDADTAEYHRYIWTTPLLQAAWSDYLRRPDTNEVIRKPPSRAMVQLLLDFDADPCQGRTVATMPLQLAVDNHDVDMVDLFLNSPAPSTRQVSKHWNEREFRANSQDPIRGHRFITVAAGNPDDDPRIIKLLLKAGARLMAESDRSAEDSPLLIALTHGNYKCAKTLVDAGADMTPVDAGGLDLPWTLWQELMVRASEVTHEYHACPDADKSEAAEYWLDILRRMVVLHQRPVAHDPDHFLDEKEARQTCLDFGPDWVFAILRERFQVSTAVLRILVDAGLPMDKKDAAVILGNYARLNADAEPFYSDAMATINLLLELGVDANQSGWQTEMTPLIHAARNANVELVDLLLAHGADVSKRDTEHGLPALTHALLSLAPSSPRGTASERVAKIVKSLLAHDCQVDGSPNTEMREQMEVKATVFQHSALMIAIRRRHTEAAELLINAGADMSTSDKDGISPSELAGVFKSTNYLIPLLVQT